jgi:hypothetical protein
MILRVCPCCGDKFEGDLCLGCPSCGARAVGPPLAKAEHKLPSLGRAFIVAGIGALMFGAFLTATILLLAQTRPISLRVWAIEYAAETAAWNLKWVEFPILFTAIWISARLVRSIRREPANFTGLCAARSGLLASILVTATIGTLIGVTVPRRLENRRRAIEAATYAKAYTLQRAMGEYRELNGYVAAEINDLRALPDPDGAIALALADVDPKGYEPTAVLAAASSRVKSQPVRGGALRNATLNSTEGELDHGVAFTSYVLRLPGEDKILNTSDDFILRGDGVIEKASEVSPPAATSNRLNIP